jgi:hypothetical protein
MYDQLKSRLIALVARPRPFRSQTERQIHQYLSEHSTNLPAFLLCAADLLEDHELDILFGPLFTPSLDERAELADLLFHWRPTLEQLQQLIAQLCQEVSHGVVRLPDGTSAPLTFHEVMAERFIRLLRLDHAPAPPVSASLRDSLPAELWPIAIALLCEPGMTPRHQEWFAAFVAHAASRRALSRESLETAVDFLKSQPNLSHGSLVTAADALLRATEGTAAYTAAGHSYWSPDVAQHHHYRGQGNIDKERVALRLAEVERVTALVEDLRTFEPAAM